MADPADNRDSVEFAIILNIEFTILSVAPDLGGLNLLLCSKGIEKANGFILGQVFIKIVIEGIVVRDNPDSRDD